MSETGNVNQEQTPFNQHDWVRYFDGDHVCDEQGKLNFEDFDFTEKDYDTTHFVIIAPNVSAHQLERELKPVLSKDADQSELDLGVSIVGSLNEKGKEEEIGRWELGWDDYRRVSIDVFPKEFFDSDANAKDVLKDVILPKIASWNEMDKPDYGFSKKGN